MTQLSRGRRRGEVFSVRVSDDERATLEAMQRKGGGPRALVPRRGPFVQPIGGGGPFCLECDPSRRSSVACNNADHRAVTPQGFARAFFEANP